MLVARMAANRPATPEENVRWVSICGVRLRAYAAFRCTKGGIAMSKTLKTLWCLCALLTAQSQVAGKPRTVRVASRGQTTLEATSGTTTVKVTIYTHELRTWSQDEANPRQPDSNCLDVRVPCSIVDAIRIVMNGKPVRISSSVYADLSDLNVAELTVGKEISILKLSGGDGAEGYDVKVEFDERSVRRRTVYWLVPDEPTEQTVYHIVDL
jgi:hypothetical protein